MSIPEQHDGNGSKKEKLRLFREKTEVYAEFLKIYGERASWENWLAFLQERPELKGFEWARSMAARQER